MTGYCLNYRADYEDFYTGKGLMIVDGEGRGQQTIIDFYDAAKRIAKIQPWRPAKADKSSKYCIVQMQGKDKAVLEIEQMLYQRETWAKGKAVEAERKRRATIRAKMWAAVRLEMMAIKDGENMLEARAREAAVAWGAYEELQDTRKDNPNMVVVGGRKVEVTWDSLVMDSKPAKKSEMMQVNLALALNICASSGQTTGD